jgi:hypothetical protein
MSKHEDGSHDRRPKELIWEAKEFAHRARQQVDSDGIEYGQTPLSDKRLLAKAAMKYWDVLHEFRDESVLSDDDVPDITPVRSRVGRTTERFVESNEIGGDFDTKQVPAVDELSGRYLYELTKAFDDVANTLGFGASAQSKTKSWGVDPGWEDEDT